MPLFLDEYSDEFVLTADLAPGITREELSIEHNDGWLSIRGKHDNVEYSSGCFLRGIKPNEATAECKNGRVTVRLPKAESAKRHVIKI